MNHKIFFLLCFLFSAIYCRKNFRILKVTTCHQDLNHSIEFAIKRKLVDGLDYYDVKINLQNDMDNNNKGIGELYTVVKDKKRKIIAVSLQNFCKFIIQRVGKFYVDLAKQLEIPHPESCPIPKGNYHLNWTELKFEDSPLLKLVPKGKFEVSVVLNSNVDQSEIVCAEARVQKV